MVKKRKARSQESGRRASAESGTAESGTAESGTAESGTAEARTFKARASASRTVEIEEPAFWFGFEVSWAKLAVGRVVLFGLLACDAILQVRHAPRYDAGDFNVAQLPGLDWLAPGRGVFGFVELALSYLFVLIACGVATRVLVPIVATLYAWLYFSSQLDSFQHHYLVALVLLLACFVPWRRPTGVTATTSVRTWALRVLLIELAIMYLWAAISKMSSAWLDGHAMSTQITGPMHKLIDSTFGFRWTARITLVVELTLAATVWCKRTWWLAAPLGILFHLGIAFSGLEIGLFAWLMIGLYVFVIPDRIWIWLARTLGALLPTSNIGVGVRWAIFGVGIGLSILMAIACRFEASLAIAIMFAVALLLVAIRGALGSNRADLVRLAVANVLAVATWCGVDRTTSVAVDYYRFWGGTARRFKDAARAEYAYRRVTQLAPELAPAHFQLGRLLIEREANDEGLEELHEAERVDGSNIRAYLYEARWLASHDRREEAIAKAKVATFLVPSDTEAQGLLSSLTAGTALPPSRDDREPSDAPEGAKAR
jgi:hypothetical protein